MGYKWEVLAWLECGEAGYDNVQLYAGQSLWQALKAMRVGYKKHGSLCISLVWRS